MRITTQLTLNLNTMITKQMYCLLGATLLLVFTSCSSGDEDILTEQDKNLMTEANIDGKKPINGNSTARTIWVNTSGNVNTNGYDGKYYQFWAKGGWGKLSLNGGGNFELEFKNNDDIVGGKGWQTGNTSRKINYNIGYQAGSYAFTGVYGWVKKGGTIIEYYVNERKNGSGGGIISGNNLNKDFGTDGRHYRFRKNNRYGPHAYGGGNTNFVQFISENKGNVSKGNNHQISMNRHFQQWGWDGGVGGGWNSHLYQVFGTENFNKKWGKINCSVW